MRYYKITLPKTGTKLNYPAYYQAQIGDHALDHLYYDEGLESRLLLVLPDSVQNVVRQNVEEITEAQAKAISETNEQRTERITDQARVERIKIGLQFLAIKKQLGLRLSSLESQGGLSNEDIKALDPDDETAGINKTKILADRIEELKKFGK